MKKLLFLIFFLATSSANIISSQNKIINTLSIKGSKNGIDKLKKLHSQIRQSKDPIDLINQLEAEAINQDNKLYLAHAYREKIYQYSRHPEPDSLKLYLNKTSDLLDLLDSNNNFSKTDKDDIEKIRITVIATKSYIYLNENKYNLVLIEVKNILENSKINKSQRIEFEAYTILGSAYLYTKNLPVAIKSFRKAYDIHKQFFANSEIERYGFYRPMEGLSIAYGGSEKYKEALQISDSLINNIEENYKMILASNKQDANSEFIYKFQKYRASCYYALWNTKTNNTQKARSLLDSIGQFIKDNYNTPTTPPDFDIYDFAETNYWYAVKDYKKAKEYALSMTSRSSIDKNLFTYTLSHLELAKILNAEGKCKEAYALIEKLYWQNDSISAMNFSDQVAEMQTLYQLDKAEMIATQSKAALKTTRMTLYIAFLVIFTTITIAILIWQNRRKIVKKNIQLYNQYIEIKNRNKEIATLQQGLIKQNDNRTEEESENDKLIEKLEDYLNETQAFLNPDLTREELALQLGTNRQYLIEAIKEKTGKTFNEYIYSFRLEYAHEQIINNRKKSISDILVEAGFLTRTTFYKSFKEVYGLTPSELRRILN